MGIWYFAHSSQSLSVLGMLRLFGIIGPNMGMAAPRAPVGGWGLKPTQKFITGLSLVVHCYLEIKFHTSQNPVLITWVKSLGQKPVPRQEPKPKR